MTSILPYWDQNIELEIVPWIPYGKDYSPVTVNSMLSPLLGNVAGLAFEMQSEFLYLRSGVKNSMPKCRSNASARRQHVRVHSKVVSRVTR